MSIGAIINNLVLGPLELLFEVIYALASRALPPGWAVVALSLVVNLLVLPLYRRADRIQRETREQEVRLAPGIQHIRKTFQGDEQFFMLQSFYRRNHYSPLSSLKSALPLALQVPFFIAAYQFLRHLGSLQGAAFGPILDLSQPDGLLRIGDVTINLLPVLMTAVNLFSGALYTKDFSLKEKLQLWGMALIFLILLYHSSAGLTLYWTMNNIFSLGKNLISRLLPARASSRPAPKTLLGAPNFQLFLLCGLVLTVLTGLLIPSAVLSASPQEFIERPTDMHPFWYMVNALLLASGTFLLWFSIYYALAEKPVRKFMELAVWLLSVLGLINYLFFRQNLGRISNVLIYDIAPTFSAEQQLINLGVLAAAAVILCFLYIKREKLVQGISLILVVTLCGMSANNIRVINREVDVALRAMKRNYTGEEIIPLSKRGKNVVILFLDRAINSYLPCILHEKPELKEVYSGFVYYPNTLSHGMHTNLGAPGLLGGYEYTPLAMNFRDALSLREKHNEALLLMPTLFSEAGYRISLFDVPYPGNYSETGDYSLFDNLPNINARKLSGTAETTASMVEEGLRFRNFFCYSLSMVVPSALYRAVYRTGTYNRPAGAALLLSGNENADADIYLDAALAFVGPYETLCRLGEITSVQEEGDTFLLLRNNTTHSPTPLQEPDYIPGDTSGNRIYDEEHQARFQAGPFPLASDGYLQMAHYEVNMAALLKVGEWIEQLKTEGVYDNTRIIIVSDHGGFQLFQSAKGVLKEAGEDIAALNPLLMVKDFGAEGEIRTDTTFMTNADVPTLAMDGIVEDAVNSFAGNPIKNDDKLNPQYVSVSNFYDVKSNCGNRFLPGSWYEVSPGGDTLFDSVRWTYMGNEAE